MSEEIKQGKRLAVWAILLLCIVSAAIWLFGRSDRIIQTGIIRYEEFQEIYNTCQKLNTDLQIIQATPESDKQFDQFSKAQRLNAIKQNLNRWVEDYNGKSKVWTRSVWKSNTLPYQLSVNDFSNFNK
mgnify:CR=1 FL=1